MRDMEREAVMNEREERETDKWEKYIIINNGKGV